MKLLIVHLPQAYTLSLFTTNNLTLLLLLITIIVLSLSRNSATMLNKEESSIVDYVFDNTGKTKKIKKKLQVHGKVCNNY